MADRGLTIGSTNSLHALAGDNIPREYHRKVLKKIAQLTKVVHNLHTKIDDHEEEMESQAAQHKVEISRLIDESSSRLKQWEEERTRVENLQIQLADLEKEKERLANEHMSYTAEVESRFHSIREQHLEKIKALSKCLSDVKLQMSNREKDCLDLQKKNDMMMAELKTADEIKKREIETLNQNYNEAARKHEQNMQLMKKNHEQHIRDLEEAHLQELQCLKNTLSNEQAGILQDQVKESEKKCQTLELNFKTKETELNQQISNISVELSETKDRLALVEQRGRDLERELSQKEKEFDSMRNSLKEKEIEISNLQKQVTLFTDKASTAMERHQQQCIEMKQMAVNLGELEALRTNYERSIVDLQQKIQTLTEQVFQLEEEKKEAFKSHQLSSKETLQKIQTLEKELEHQSQEKRRLHAQYAREIEAAHSKLTEKETSLEENYLRSIQQLREQHQQELSTLQKEMKENLDLLQAQLDSKKSSELSTLSEKHQTELVSLSQTLSERTNELRKLQDSYDNLRSTLAEKERQLGSMTACVDELKQELATCKNDLNSLQKERDSFKVEATQLQLSLDTLKSKFSQIVSTHKDEMVKTEHTVQQQMEEHWTNKLRTKLSSLRQELQQQYNEMNQAALNKTIDLKDKAFKEAEQEWEKDKDRLLQKIKELEKEISDLHYSSEAALRQVNFEAQNELAELKQQLQREQEEAEVVVEELTKQKKLELEQLEQALKKEKELFAQEMVASHQKELIEVHQANQLSITALKDELKKQNKKAMTELQELHQKDLESLEEQLKQDHLLSLNTLQSQYNDKLKQNEVKSQEKITHLNTELSSHKTTVAELSEEIGDCRNLLMREKERVSQLTVELSTTKKHLQVKHEEVLATKREATIQIKLQEDQLSSAHRAEVDSLHSQQRHQTQLLLNDFNKAKQLLTTKLQETEQRLLEAEQRYRNREPRPEDVKYIKELKRLVAEQEMKTKELIAEKKLYQLELMNREKNYNKLFNSSPYIGVLDPLHIKKKAKESTGGSTSTLRYSSDPSLFTPSSMDSLPSLNGSGSLLEPSTLPHRTQSPHKLPSKGGEHCSHNDGELPGLVPSPVMSSHSLTTLNTGQHKLKFLSGSGQSNQHRKEQTENKIGRLLDSFPPSQSKVVHAVH